MCEKYFLRKDIICDDCDEFICKKCVKIDYMDYDWIIIFIVVSIKRRDLKMFIKKMKENELWEIDKIKMVGK